VIDVAELLETGAPARRAHTPQEWVSVDEVRAADVYVALARALAEEERNP
jgi:di/tripeptidase